MECKLCGKQLPNKRRRRCQSCNTRIRRFRTKLAAVKWLGGKCVRCGYDGDMLAMEFHHKDPAQKDFIIGRCHNKSWEVVKKELCKCELLCANCHRIEHGAKSKVFLQEATSYQGRILPI